MGGLVRVSPLHARVLVLLGRAKYAEESPKPVVPRKPRAPKTDPDKPKRTYRRRDMKAEE